MLRSDMQNFWLNLNGTDAGDLSEDRCAISRAIEDAAVLLVRLGSPHGRDYRGDDSSAYKHDREQATEHYLALQKISRYYMRSAMLAAGMKPDEIDALIDSEHETLVNA